MARIMQPAFTGGELSPSLNARVDINKYHVGAKELTNFFVHAHGGASNRPGTQYLGDARREGRLIPFQFSVEQVYILEFTDTTMRIIQDNGLVVYPAGHPSAGQIVEITHPYGIAEIGGLTYAQSADTMFFASDKHPPTSLTRTDHHEWTFTTMTFTPTVGIPKLGINSTEYAGAVLTAATYDYARYQVSAIGYSGEESLPSAETAMVQVEEAAVVGVSAGLGYEAIVANGLGGMAGAGVHEWVLSALGGNTYYLKLRGVGDPEILEPDAFFQMSKLAKVYTGVPNPPYIFPEELTKSLSLAAALSAGEWAYGDADTLGHDTIYIHETASGNPDNFDIERILFRENGVAEYVFYRNKQGFSGAIAITKAPAVRDYFTNDEDTQDKPQQARTPFSSVDNYPGSVAIYQQRLIFARTNNRPQTVWATRTGNLSNLSVSQPLKDDDAIEATIASTRVNEIKHMTPMRNLMVMTSGAEWVMGSGNNTDAMTPTTVRFDIQGYRGVGSVPPIVVGNTLLFAQRSGKKVLDMFYQLETDGFTGSDLTIMANHIFRDITIKEWAYQEEPESILWVVGSDGNLYGLTYVRDHEVFAWHRHVTDGAFESIATVPGDAEDDVYFIVKRIINGIEKRFLEKLTTRLPNLDLNSMIFMDSSLSRNSGAVTNLSGLDHLEGETVAVLADGNAVEGLVVVGGNITLPTAATNIHVGLPYTSTLVTLGVDPGQELQGKTRTIPRVVLRMQDTRGGFVGPTGGRQVEMKLRQSEDYNEATGLFTGDIEVALKGKWGKAGSLTVTNPDPVAITVLGLLPDVQVGE